MRLAILTTDYAPLCSSTAVQLRDLAQEFVRQGHDPVIICPSEGAPSGCDVVGGVKVLRFAAPRMKEVSRWRRGLAEIWMPFAAWRGMRRSRHRSTEWDAIVWWSPSIFFGPLVAFLKWRSRCSTYLILRDLFPEWARDLGILNPGPAYLFFKVVAKYQYSVADTIGVQTASNLSHLDGWARAPGRRLEVLQNWLAMAPSAGSSIRISATTLAGRTIFVYAGNMGAAQAVDIFLDLAEVLQADSRLGFLFVGRGTDVPRLRARAQERALANVVFRDQVDSREMPDLLSQCHIGLLALDPRHRTHNIPGKFLTYMQAGLPVLARINAGNDLADLIEKEGVGRTYIGSDVRALRAIAEQLVQAADERPRMAARARALNERLFSPHRAVTQITAALERPMISHDGTARRAGDRVLAANRRQ